MIAVPGLEFDEEKHEYKWHGKQVPSVTTILKSAGIVDAAWYTEEARIRGTHVHQAAQFYDEGDLAPGSIRPEIQPYMDAYVKFKRDTGFYPILIEQKVIHTKGYAGTLDRVGWLNDRLVQIDLKSGGIPKWAGLQTEAYKQALEEMISLGHIKLEQYPEARFALQLTSEGKYKLQPLQGLSDGHYFWAALEIHKFKVGA